MQVIVDGKPIAYTDEGKGAVLVFVHGWRDSKETWRQVITELKDSNRCIALDLPNFGTSGENAAITSLDAYAQLLSAFLQKLEIETYALVGHSMGGQIAAYGVGSGIVQPTRLVLIAASGVRDEKQTQKQLLRAASKPFRRVLPSAVKAKFYKKIGSDYDPSLSPVLKKIIAEMLDTDVQSVASAITIPTLLVYGELDTSTPPRFGKKLQLAIHGSQYVELTAQDHWLHQRAAKEVARYTKEFIG